MHNKLVYLGYNSFLKHKRGVENVIEFQSRASFEKINYYLHWDDSTKVYRNKNFICIALKKGFFWPFILNHILLKIKFHNGSIFIHSHNPLMSIVSIFKTNILTVHDALYYLNAAKGHSLKYIFYALEKILYKRAKFVHFISNYAKKMSLLASDANNFIIVPNTSHYEEISNERSDSLKIGVKSEFDPTKYKILVVRSIELRARLDLVIQLAEASHLSNFEILVAGKGPLLKDFISEVNQKGLKNIKFLGYVDDGRLMDLYRECDLVLMPAEYGEGFGLPIIEGYLYNKPVIASNKCAIPEVIISPNYIFENKLPSILEKIKYVRNNDFIGFKEYYNSTFSNAVIINKMSAVYMKLIGCLR